VIRRSLVALLLLSSACDHAAHGTPAPPATSAAPAKAKPSSQDVLDGMDARAPVPLLPMMANHQKQNMRDHLVAVREIASALARRDFAAVDAAGQRIGYSETMGRMCTHMGLGAPGFTEAALEFHRSADKIARAARQHDSEGVLLALEQTLDHCTSCHAKYKQQVVDEATWSALTQATPPQPAH
jgi:hypothetical protein